MSPLNLNTLAYLLTSAGQQWLAVLQAEPVTPANHVAWATRLRAAAGPEAAQALLETALLRQRAEGKFSRADRMLFTRSGLEQASAEAVGTYRAGIFWQAGLRSVADLCCGLGGDALALAGNGPVFGVDLNPVRLAMARHNVAVYKDQAAFLPMQADVTCLPGLLPGVQALFFDPARRDDRGRRLYSLHQYQPAPLPLLAAWRQRVPHVAVKISPGVDYAELPADSRVEFISLDGEVKEGVLWFGDLQPGARRRATLLPGGHTLVHDPAIPPAPISPPQRYLIEPDGAVIRAHLIAELAAQLDAAQIDATIAYLTTDTSRETPFARVFAVEAHFPFQLKRLRQYLRAQGVGQVVIKKRGSPLDVDQLERSLKLRGSAARVLFLTQVQGEPTVIVALPPAA